MSCVNQKKQPVNNDSTEEFSPVSKYPDTYNPGQEDNDNDGIGDAADECPEEPGVARYNGCPIPDSDGDGFNDEDDECPQTKGDLRGCPDPRG